MKLFVPEPEIDLYNDGFVGHDLLGRAATGKQLSELVEKIQDPIVIALDGAWGSGKSFFLKCWAGAHTVENGGSAKVIYFDAFKHDFLDDPLVALTGVLADRFSDKRSKAGKAVDAAKTAVTKLWRPALRVGVAAATASASEIVGAIGNAALNGTADELKAASDEFWKKEDGRRAAMREFGDALVKLTKSGEDESPQKIVIIIDELDRCRPDYALSLLEIIKHFFAVDHVHFVLGINLKEFECSVLSRYGEKIDAGIYLQKFIHLVLPITKKNLHLSGNSGSDYFEKILANTAQSQYNLTQNIVRYLRAMPHSNQISLRGAERLFSKIAVIPEISNDNLDECLALSGLMVLELCRPDWIENIKGRTLSHIDALNFFGLNEADSKNSNPFRLTVYWIWRLTLDPEFLVQDEQIAGGIPPGLNNSNMQRRRDLLPKLIDSHLKAFDLPW